MARREGGPRLPPHTYVAGYGGPDSTDLQDMTVVPPGAYRLRYGVTARGRFAPDPYAVESVSVTDRNTGAFLTFEDGTPVLARLPADLDSKAMAVIWRDARYLAGWAKLPAGGRPPGLTTIQSDDEIIPTVRTMRKDRRRVTQERVVANAGTFTLAELRGYLRVTGRKWAEFLRSF